MGDNRAPQRSTMLDEERVPAEGSRGARALELTEKVPFLWALVALALAALAGAAAFVLIGAARGPRPPFLDAAGAPATARPLASSRPANDPSAAIQLAGSGSNLPLVRSLVEGVRRSRPEAKYVVHASIGSGGGVRAVRDGAVDVGLISRPLTGEEARMGLVVTPHARVAVVVAAHPSVPDACVSSRDLTAMYSGIRTDWSDGSRIVVLQRERGDSSFLAVSQRVPGLAAANDAAYQERRWRVLYDDRTMQEALVTTEGATGFFDLGAIIAQRLPIKVLCVDGVAPSAEAASAGAGAYPYWKDLAFVTAGPPDESRGAALIRFALSDPGRALTAELGYVPLPLGPVQVPDRPQPPQHHAAPDGGAP